MNFSYFNGRLRREKFRFKIFWRIFFSDFNDVQLLWIILKDEVDEIDSPKIYERYDGGLRISFRWGLGGGFPILSVRSNLILMLYNE